MDDEQKRMARGLILVVVILAAAFGTYRYLSSAPAADSTKADLAQQRLEEMRKNQGDAAPVETRAEDTPPPTGPIRHGPTKLGS
ncbi:MAG: hypothetical protein GC200_05765 [Tepidisphaera sp.]|nr:hypothetical protein [Tepidisphaera sp.]